MTLDGVKALEARGEEWVPPAVVFDQAAYDEVGLTIYRELRKAVDDCARILETAGESRYRNLAAVFIHELLHTLYVRVTTRLTTDRAAAEGLSLEDTPTGDGDFWAWSGPSRTEWGLRERTARQGRRTVRSLRLIARNFKESTLPRALLALRRTSVKRLAYIRELAEFDTGTLVSELNRAARGSRWALHRLDLPKIRFNPPQREAQWAALRDAVRRLSRGWHGQAWPDADIDRLLTSVFGGWLIERDEVPIQGDVLLTGTQTGIVTRVTAALARAQGVPVVSICHGEGCGAHDEPVFGYGENAYPLTVIGFGEVGCAQATTGEFTVPLFGDPIPWVPAACATTADLAPNTVPSLASVASPTYLYAPTAFSGENAYGPFRALHDLAYLHWQRGLMAELSTRAPGKVTWKLHTKDQQLDRLGTGWLSHGVSGVTIERDIWFEELMEQTDVFVFDYLSSAMFVAMATGKPIIYLDVGARNLYANVLEAIKQRCIYVRADPSQPKAALSEAFEQADREFVRHTMAPFTALPGRCDRAAITARVVSEMAAG